jgi:hypothetical protein
VNFDVWAELHRDGEVKVIKLSNGFAVRSMKPEKGRKYSGRVGGSEKSWEK